MKLFNTPQSIALTALILISIAWVPSQSQNSVVYQTQPALLSLEDTQRLKDRIVRAERLPALNATESTGTSPSISPQETTESAPTKANSSIDLYGYVMLDSGYEFGQSDPNWFDVMRPTKLPSFRGQVAPDGKVYFGEEVPEERCVDLDTTIAAMALTAKEMNVKYKETSEGGLAVSLVLC